MMSYKQDSRKADLAAGSTAASMPAGLTGRIASALEQRLGREFMAGAQLPTESELAAAYAVSRTVVREAMSQLRARGLVETRRGIGTFATVVRDTDRALSTARRRCLCPCRDPGLA